MADTKLKNTGQTAKNKFSSLQRIVGEMYSRAALAWRMGKQYSGKRDIYKALGYPDEADLDFTYYLAKYDRQDIASTIIDKPVDKTWNGEIEIIEEDTSLEDSKLAKEWDTLNEDLKVKTNLVRLDKLTGLGQFGIMLFGFSDVKERKDFKEAVGGEKLKLLYVKPFGEGSVTIDEWETDTSNERYGMPRYYKVLAGEPGNDGVGTEITVHHSRVIHIVGESLSSDVYGRPRLKPVVNRLEDLEKIFGGDAEMFWRGARPGYTAIGKDDYEMSDTAWEDLEDELDKYEHDLRRFITAQGIDIKTLEQQVADPINHIDVQLQAISAKTNIPKRILIGSERGELSSSQDQNEWLSYIKTRMEEFAEPQILRPFIDKCMEHGILTKVENYNVLWEDLFAQSEKEKVDLGKARADALKVYADSPYAADILPAVLAYKYLLGFTEEQAEEIQQAADDAAEDEAVMAEKLDKEVNAEIGRRALEQQGSIGSFAQSLGQGSEINKPIMTKPKSAFNRRLSRLSGTLI